MTVETKTQTDKKVVTNEQKKGRGRPKTEKKPVQKVQKVRTRFNDIVGDIKKEGEFTFAQSYDKVQEGFIRIVKYSDTTVKVFDKEDYEITPAKATICRAIAILDNFNEEELSSYTKRSTTRSAGARLLKLLSDQTKQVEVETVVEESE